MLDQLTAGAREDAASRRERVPYADLERLALATPRPIDVAERLRGDHLRVIAEVKRASPSRGRLAHIPEPAALASAYETGGAAVVSVLTEQRKFLGSLDDLRAVRDAVAIPVLRKDFTSEEYQILEARAAGADMVLLIVAALDQPTLARLFTFARSLELSVLVETHSAEELDRALELDPQIVGVNARNLSTFEMDASLFPALRSTIPDSVVAVAESGLLSLADVQRVRSEGADAILAGEVLVVDGDPRARVAEFAGVA